MHVLRDPSGRTITKNTATGFDLVTKKNFDSRSEDIVHVLMVTCLISSFIKVPPKTKVVGLTIFISLIGMYSGGRNHLSK